MLKILNKLFGNKIEESKVQEKSKSPSSEDPKEQQVKRDSHLDKSDINLLDPKSNLPNHTDTTKPKKVFKMPEFKISVPKPPPIKVLFQL